MTSALMAWWRKLGKRQQLIITVLGGALLLWMTDLVTLRPLRYHLHHLHEEVRGAEQRLVDGVIANEQAGAVNKAFEAYASYVKPVGAPESELAGVLSEVEAAVRQSGMVLLNLKPLSQRADASSAISVTIDGEATPSQLVRLLDQLQRSPHLLKVAELTVRVSESQTLRTSLVISRLLLK